MAGFDNDVVYASNVDFTGSATVTGRVTTDGQLLIGSTVSPNVRVGTLGSSDGSITWTLGNGTITGQVSPATWIDQGSGTTLTINSNYFATAAETLTLPASPAQGSKISVIVDTTGAVVIQANTGQTIRIGFLPSSVAGTLTSTARGDSLVLIYRSTGSVWITQNSMGNWTVA